METNDITGDKLQSKPTSEGYRSKYELIDWSRGREPLRDGEQSSLHCPSVTMDDIDAIGEAVGMYHDGWDMVSPITLITAALNHFTMNA